MDKSKSRTAKPGATAPRADQPVQKGSKATKEPGKSSPKRKPGLQESESHTKSVQPKEKLDRVNGIRTSADGRQALSELLDQIQSNSGMTFVYAQHLDPKHESMLLDLLSKATKQPVALKEGMQQEVTKLREELEHRNVELNRLRENQKHIEAELRREKKRGQLYLDVTGVILLIIDDKEKVSLINNVGCELLGYSENEIIGKNWFDRFIPERMRAEAKAFFSRLMDGQTDKVESYENPVLTKSGHERPIVWRCVVLKDDSGVSIGMLCSGLDVTALQSAELACKRAETALRDSEERFRLMVESLGDYEFVMMDPSGYVTSWAAAERMNSYREDEIVGQHFSCFYPAEDFQAGRPMKILSVAETEGRFEEDGWRIRKNGARKWANNVITAQRDESGKLRGFSSITRYMGERVRERKLRFD